MTAWGEEIVETDDPRWIEAEHAVSAGWAAVNEAAFTLVTVQPTTRAGTLSLLRYALEKDTDGEQWSVELLADDGRQRHWYYFLIDNVVAALDPDDDHPQYPIL